MIHYDIILQTGIKVKHFEVKKQADIRRFFVIWYDFFAQIDKLCAYMRRKYNNSHKTA